MGTPNYAGLIDHTYLKPFATREDWRNLCRQAVEYGFKTVAINNAGIEICREFLDDAPVLVDAAVSFPLGQCTLETKLFETKDAIAKGAEEVDYVINIGRLKMGDWSYINREMEAIVSLCRERGVTSKVIFETCYLTDNEKKRLCETAGIIRPDFIKTSTGFGTAGASVDDVRLMRRYAPEEVKIKASGGIREGESFLSMVEAGAERIGTSAGLAIMEALRIRGA